MTPARRPSLLGLLLAAPCPGCRRPSPDVVCGACLAHLAPPPPLAVPAGLRSLHALAAYQGPLPRIVLDAKNGRRLQLLRTLGIALGQVTSPGSAATVTWAPTTSTRRRRRGFDHAEVLARAVASQWGLPCASLLVRVAGDAQCGRSATERQDGLRFVARRPVAGGCWLVDDVCTTGATLRAASLALLGAGADAVDGLVLGRVALKPEPKDADTLHRA